MNFRRVLASLIAAVSLLGCATKGAAPVVEPDRPEVTSTMSVAELASTLRLELRDDGSRGAMLEDRVNTVSLFPPPNGRVYVNGEPLGAPGSVVADGDGLRIDASLAPIIARALRSESSLRPAPRRPIVPISPVAPGDRSTAFLGRLVIDQGHGGKDPGAIGVNKLYEKRVVLDVSKRTAERLRREGLDVALTRDGDRFIELDDRVSYGNRRRPLLFVSIHADAAESRSARGFTVYVARKASSGSLRAARAIRAALRRTGVTDRGIKRADYRVLKNATGPAVLVELGFLSNRSDAAALASSSHRAKMSAAVARGILAYLVDIGRGK